MKNYGEKKVNMVAAGVNSRLVARDLYYKNLEPKVFDKSVFNKGMEWFNSGLALDDAPEELKNNSNFSDGFEKGKRIKLINDNLLSLGMEWFNSGFALENAPSNYSSNEHFILGYESAKKSAEFKSVK